MLLFDCEYWVRQFLYSKSLSLFIYYLIRESTTLFFYSFRNLPNGTLTTTFEMESEAPHCWWWSFSTTVGQTEIAQAECWLPMCKLGIKIILDNKHPHPNIVHLQTDGLVSCAIHHPMTAYPSDQLVVFVATVNVALQWQWFCTISSDSTVSTHTHTRTYARRQKISRA